MKTDISVVIPVHNEEKNLRPLHDRITANLAKGKASYEVIFVDDGSTDSSLTILKELCRNDKRVKAVGLSRNFGHEIATTAGLRYSKGDAVIVMDADLQHPPEALPSLIKKSCRILKGINRNIKLSLLNSIIKHGLILNKVPGKRRP